MARTGGESPASSIPRGWCPVAQQVGNLIDNIADETCALILLQQP